MKEIITAVAEEQKSSANYVSSLRDASFTGFKDLKQHCYNK